MKLPELFKERMKELLGEEFDEYLACLDENYAGGVRVNTLKLSPEEFEDIAPFPVTRIPFVKKGFYYDEKEQPAKHPYYFGGLYYIQEPSAMVPASLLPVNPGDKVLDLCAAPGGKSTELGARLSGRGVLVSNDISNSRAKALLKNVELFGIRNAVVVSETPVKLSKEFPGYFDKILVDAPCSGEGMFRKTPAIMKNWEQYGVEYYNKLQKDILPHAVSMLKPGGYLLYSTCTFSPEEDEGTIDWLLSTYPQMELVPAIQESGSEDADYSGFAKGKPEWLPSGSRAELEWCVRLWPHKIGGEGHFLALLHKKEDEISDKEIYPDYTQKNVPRHGCDISKEAREFLTRIKFPMDVSRFMIKEGRIYLLPEGIPEMKGLRILRSGLLLGEEKKGRFEPSQALASSLKKEEYDAVYDMDSNDPDVIRYLKCESVNLKKEVKDGWVLICVDGYPLGWGKANRGTLKNKYLPGWRMMHTSV